jgi:hypothetical protein
MKPAHGSSAVITTAARITRHSVQSVGRGTPPKSNYEMLEIEPTLAQFVKINPRKWREGMDHAALRCALLIVKETEKKKEVEDPLKKRKRKPASASPHRAHKNGRRNG